MFRIFYALKFSYGVHIIVLRSCKFPINTTRKWSYPFHLSDQMILKVEDLKSDKTQQALQNRQMYDFDQLKLKDNPI